MQIIFNWTERETEQNKSNKEPQSDLRFSMFNVGPLYLAINPI